jgi:L-2-hydroxyglutarate oxidase LhgO
VRLGPDDEYLKNRIKDYSVDVSKTRSFALSARSLMPFLEESDLHPDTSGIRPKLQEEGGAFRDFVICEEADTGLPGFMNLIGIESPGLTACLAIGRYIEQSIKKCQIL